ncbi:MAG: class I SAM-dependent methyltransferase [Bacteroidetes bacterium]|nr:class I SAM-dependent methyltransferase [Bacteroidota bacterium]
MSKLTHYNNCPVCNSNKISFALKAKDETVSHDYFEIWECASCCARFTQDIPGENEIGEYYKSSAYISHSNTSQGLVNKLYHSVRSYTLQSKRKLIEKKSAKGNLLDVGAGTGAFAATMKKSGWDVTALEPDATAREHAQNDFDITLAPLENLFNLPAASFQVITLWHVLEHVHQLHQYLETFYKLLADGGTLIIAVPNYTSYDAKKYGTFWAAYDVPRHLYHFSPASMHWLLQHHRFTPEDMRPMWFDSFYVSLLSEKYKSGINHFLSAFTNGTISNIKSLGNYKNCSSVIYFAKK